MFFPVLVVSLVALYLKISDIKTIENNIYLGKFHSNNVSVHTHIREVQ